MTAVRAMNVSIRTQLAGAIGLVVALLAALLIAYLPHQLDAAARENFRERATELAGLVAASVAPGLEFEDAPGTNAALTRLEHASEAAYALVQTKDGAVFAAWRASDRPATPSGLEDAVDADLTVGELDVPIEGREGTMGRLILGMKLDPVVQEHRATLRAVLGVSGALLAIGLLLAWLIGTFLTRPLVQLVDAADRMAEGDLSVDIDATRGDEIGQLARAYLRLAERLREVPRRLGASTKLLAEAVQRLQSASGAQSDVLQRQAAALRETQVTAEEMRVTSGVAAGKAADVVAAAERAESLGKAGATAVEASLSGLSEVRQRTFEMTKQIEGLSERARQVATITEKVKTLADQSNMLALNAAIEAVRSGEHGKGFAVVAREMRTLADKSIASTNEVRRILEDIRLAVESAVQSADEGRGRIEIGAGQISTSGETIRELTGIVGVNAGNARQIAAAVSQQHQGVTQINVAMGDLSKLMGDTLERLEETKGAIELLGAAAGEVDTVVAGFRV